jgi:cytochrome oxidase Cu insertion factor (SCO1/SenC/PrrC family)
MTPANTPNPRRGRLQFLGLAALFLGPLGLAFWMYYGGHLIPGHKVNHGALLDPVQTLPPSAGLQTPSGALTGSDLLRRRWSLVYVTGNRCDEACLSTLGELSKVRLAMDHERDRVQRVLLGAAPCCTVAEVGEPAADLAIAYTDGPVGQALLAALPPPAGRSSPESTIYIVDPLGNLVMRFAASDDRKGLIKDLEKLLRLSHIG